MIYREGMSYEEHSEAVQAARERFQNNEITENKFRELLASLGFNATEIDSEVNSLKE